MAHHYCYATCVWFSSIRAFQNHSVQPYCNQILFDVCQVVKNSSAACYVNLNRLLELFKFTEVQFRTPSLVCITYFTIKFTIKNRLFVTIELTRRTKTANITKDDATSASHRQTVTVLQK